MTTTFQAIEEIDISSLFKPTELQSPEVDVLIANALASDGAFVAMGLPGSNHLDKEMSNLMRFFDLPLEMKLRFATKNYQPSNPNNYRGYYPLPEIPNWAYKEGFDIGPEPALSCPNIPGTSSFREPNVWPNEADLPEWRSKMLDQLQQIRALEILLMAAIARGMELDPKPFLTVSHGRNAMLRLLSRPTLPAEFQISVMNKDDGGEKKALTSEEPIEDGRRIITGRHVDENLLSVLWQSSTGGLQMEGSDGTWKEVYPQAGTLSIHCGTLLAHLSGNQLVGTPHRVVSDGSSRTSVGHFLEPNYETQIWVSGNTESISYAQHLVNEYPDRFIVSEAA